AATRRPSRPSRRATRRPRPSAQDPCAESRLGFVAAPKLTVVGSINLDLVVRVRRFPKPGETVRGTTLSRWPGGKGANQAVAAGKLGAGVRMVGCGGDDDFAEEALAGLKAAGVTLDLCEPSTAGTGVALITVDESGENQIVVSGGANLGIRDFDVSDAD